MNLEFERAALMQTSRDWARADGSGDLELTLSFWSDEAIVMPPGQPTVVGQAAIREFLRQTSAIPGFSISWEPEQANVARQGDVGYMVERNRITLTEADGAARTQFGKAVTIWRKDSMGAWKCVRDTRADVLGHPEYHACRRHVMEFLEHHAHQMRASALDTVLSKSA